MVEYSVKVQLGDTKIEAQHYMIRMADGSETWVVDMAMELLANGKVRALMPAFQWSAEAISVEEAEELGRREIHRQHELALAELESRKPKGTIFAL